LAFGHNSGAKRYSDAACPGVGSREGDHEISKLFARWRSPACGRITPINGAYCYDHLIWLHHDINGGLCRSRTPSKPIQRIVTLVSAPGSLASSIKSSVVTEAAKRGVAADDARALFPPTRTYTDAEIRKDLARQRIDGVLLINVGDTGVIREYAGTVFSGQYSGSSAANVSTFGNTGTVNTTSTGTMTTTATPTYRYSRQTAFTARLIDAASGRNLWVGQGQVNAGGLLFIGDGANANSSVSAIFDDLQRKKIIGETAS
jgi:hypothetical protein